MKDSQVRVLSAIVLMLLSPLAAWSQVGQPAPDGSGTGSETKTEPASSGGRMLPHEMNTAPVALRGYCPVCLVEKMEWIKGKPEFQVTVDGKTYQFPDGERMAMFQAAPEKYVPALGGDCPVHFARTRQRIPGQLRFGLVHAGRLFFFTSDQHRQMFFADSKPFADLDLALGGQCVVCRRDMNQVMPGLPTLTAIHGGLRYRFAGLPQRDSFLASPAVYEAYAATLGGSGTMPGSATQDAGSSGSRPAGAGATTTPGSGTTQPGSQTR